MNEQSSGTNKSPPESTSVVQHIESESFPYRLPVWKLSAQPIRFSNNEVINANTIRIRSCDFNTNYYNISFNNNCIRWLRKVRLDVNDIVTEQFPNNINVVNPYFTTPPKDEWHLCTLYITPSQYDNVDSILTEMNYRFNESIKSLFTMTSKTLPSKDGISYSPQEEIDNISAFALKDVSIYEASMNTYNNYPASYIVDGDMIYTKPSTNETRYISNCIIDLQMINDVNLSESVLINPRFEGNKIKIYESSGSQYVYNVSILNSQHQGNIAILNDTNMIKASTTVDVRYTPMKSKSKLTKSLETRDITDLVTDSSLTTTASFLDNDRIIASSFDDTDYSSNAVSFDIYEPYSSFSNSNDPTDITTYSTVLPERLKCLTSRSVDVPSTQYISTRSVDVPSTRALTQSSILDYDTQLNPLKFNDIENILINKVHIKSFPEYVGLANDSNRFIFNNSRYHYTPMYNPDLEITFDVNFTAHNDDDNIYLTADDGTISIKSTAFNTSELEPDEIMKERKSASLINYFGWIANDPSLPKLKVLLNDNSKTSSQYPYYQLYTGITTQVPTHHNVYYHNTENTKTHTYSNTIDFIKTATDNKNIDVWFDLRNATVDFSRLNPEYSEWLYSYSIKSGLLNEFIIDSLSCSPKLLGYKLHSIETNSNLIDFSLTQSQAFPSRISPSPAIKISEEFVNVTEKMNVDNIIADLKSSTLIIPISSLTKTDKHGLNELAYSKKITTDLSVTEKYQYLPDGIYYSDSSVSMNYVSFMVTEVMQVSVIDYDTRAQISINSPTTFTRVPDNDGNFSDTNPVYSELFINASGDVIILKPKYIINYKNNKLNAATIRINTKDNQTIVNGITVLISSCIACDVNGNIERLWYKSNNNIYKLSSAATEIADIYKCYTNGTDTKNYVLISLYNDNKYDSILDTSNNIDNDSTTNSLNSLKIYRTRDEDLYTSIMLPMDTNGFNYSDVYTSKIKDLLYLPFGVCKHIGILASNLSEDSIDDTYIFNDVVDTNLTFKFDKIKFRNLNKLLSTTVSTTTSYKQATSFNEGHKYFVRNIDNEYIEIKNANMLFTGVTNITDKNKNTLFGSNLIRYYVSNIDYTEVVGDENIATLDQKYYKYNNIYSYIADNNKYALDDSYKPKNGGDYVCITKVAKPDASIDLPFNNSANMFTTTEVKYDIDGNASYAPNATELAFDTERDVDLVPFINNLFTGSPTETEKKYLELNKSIIYISNRNYETSTDFTSDLYLFKGVTPEDHKNQLMYTPINSYQMNSMTSAYTPISTDVRLNNKPNLELITTAITDIMTIDKTKYNCSFPLTITVIENKLYTPDHTQVQIYSGTTRVDVLSANVSQFTINRLPSDTTFVCNGIIAKVFLHDDPKTELSWSDILALAELENADSIKFNYDQTRRCSYVNTTFVDIKILSVVNDYDPVGSYFYNNNVGSLDASLNMFYKYISYFESASGTTVNKVRTLLQASPYEYTGYNHNSKTYTFKITDLNRFAKEYTFTSSNKLSHETELTTNANDMCSWKPVELAPHVWGFMKFDRSNKYVCSVNTNTTEVSNKNAWICGSSDEYKLLRAFNNVNVTASNSYITVDYLIAVKDKGVDFKLLDGMLFKLSEPGKLLESMEVGDFLVLHYGACKHLLVPDDVNIPSLASDEYAYIDNDGSLKVSKLMKKIIPSQPVFTNEITNALVNNLSGETSVRVHSDAKNFEFIGEFVSSDVKCSIKSNTDGNVEIIGGGTIHVKETSTGDVYKIKSNHITIEGKLRSAMITGNVTIDEVPYTSVKMSLLESMLYLSETESCDLTMDENVNINLNTSDYVITKTTMNVSDVTLAVGDCTFTTSDVDTAVENIRLVKDYTNIANGLVFTEKPSLPEGVTHQFNYSYETDEGPVVIHTKPVISEDVTHYFEYTNINDESMTTTTKPTMETGVVHKFRYEYVDEEGNDQIIESKPAIADGLTHQFTYTNKDNIPYSNKPTIPEGVTHQFTYATVIDGVVMTVTDKPSVATGVVHEFKYTHLDGEAEVVDVNKPTIPEGTVHQFNYSHTTDEGPVVVHEKPSNPVDVVHRFEFTPIVNGTEETTLTTTVKPATNVGATHKFKYTTTVDGEIQMTFDKPKVINTTDQMTGPEGEFVDGEGTGEKTPSVVVPEVVTHYFEYTNASDDTSTKIKPTMTDGITHGFEYAHTDGTKLTEKPSIAEGITHQFNYSHIVDENETVTTTKPTIPAGVTHVFNYNDGTNSTTTKPTIPEGVTHQLNYTRIVAGTRAIDDSVDGTGEGVSESTGTKPETGTTPSEGTTDETTPTDPKPEPLTTTTKPTIPAGVTHVFNYNDGTNSTTTKPSYTATTKHRFAYTNTSSPLNRPVYKKPTGANVFTYIPYIDEQEGEPTTTKPTVSDTVTRLKFIDLDADGATENAIAYEPEVENLSTLTETELVDLAAEVANSTYIVKSNIIKFVKFDSDGETELKVVYDPPGALDFDAMNDAELNALNVRIGSYTYTVSSVLYDTSSKQDIASLKLIKFKHHDTVLYEPSLNKSLADMDDIELLAIESNMTTYTVTSSLSDDTSTMNKFVFGDKFVYEPAITPPANDVERAAFNAMPVNTYTVASSLSDGTSKLIKFNHLDVELYLPSIVAPTNEVERLAIESNMTTYTVTSSLSDGTSTMNKFVFGDKFVYEPSPIANMDSVELSAFTAMLATINTYTVTSSLSDGTSKLLKFKHLTTETFEPSIVAPTNDIERLAFAATPVDEYYVASVLSDGTSKSIRFRYGENELYLPTLVKSTLNAAERAALNSNLVTFDVYSSLSNPNAVMNKFVFGSTVTYEPTPVIPVSSMNEIELAAFNDSDIVSYTVTSVLSSGVSNINVFECGTQKFYEPALAMPISSMNEAEKDAFDSTTKNIYRVTSVLSDHTSILIKFVFGSTVTYEPLLLKDESSFDDIEKAAFATSQVKVYQVSSTFTNDVKKFNKYVYGTTITYEPSLAKSESSMNPTELAAFNATPVTEYSIISMLSDPNEVLIKFVSGSTVTYEPSPKPNLNASELAALNDSDMYVYTVTSGLSDGTSTMNKFVFDTIITYEPSLVKPESFMNEAERTAFNSMKKNLYTVASMLSDPTAVLNKYMFNAVITYEPPLAKSTSVMNASEIAAMNRIKTVTYNVSSILEKIVVAPPTEELGKEPEGESIPQLEQTLSPDKSPTTPSTTPTERALIPSFKFIKFISYAADGTTIDKTVYEPSLAKPTTSMNASELAAFNASDMNVFTVTSSLSDPNSVLNKYVFNSTITYEPPLVKPTDSMNEIELAALNSSDMVVYTITTSLTDGSMVNHKFINYSLDNTDIESTVYEPTPSKPIDSMNASELAAFNTLATVSYNVTNRYITETLMIPTEHISTTCTLTMILSIKPIETLPTLINLDNKVSLAGTVKSLTFTNFTGTNIAVDYTKNVTILGDYVINNGIITVTNPTIGNEFFPSASESHSIDQPLLPTGTINGKPFASTVNGFTVSSITTAKLTVSSPTIDYTINGTMTYVHKSISHPDTAFVLTTTAPSISNTNGIVTVVSTRSTINYTGYSIISDSFHLSQNLATSEFTMFNIHGIIIYLFIITQLPKIYEYVVTAPLELKGSFNQVIISDNEADRSTNVDDKTLIHSRSITITYSYDSQSSETSKIIHCYHLWPSLVTGIDNVNITHYSNLNKSSTVNSAAFSVDVMYIPYVSATHNMLSSYYKSSTTIGNVIDKYLTFVIVSGKYQPLTPFTIPSTIEHASTSVYKSTIVSTSLPWYIKTESFVSSATGTFFGSPEKSFTFTVSIANRLTNRLGYTRLGTPSTPVDPLDTSSQYQYIKVLSSELSTLNTLYPLMNVSEDPASSYYLIPISSITNIKGSQYTITFATRAYFQPMILYRYLLTYTSISKAITSAPNHDISNYYIILNPYEYTPVASLTLYRYNGTKTFTTVSMNGISDDMIITPASRYYLKLSTSNIFIRLSTKNVYTTLSQFEHIYTYVKSDTGEFCYVNNEYVLRSLVVTGKVYSKQTIYSEWNDTIPATIKYIAVNNTDTLNYFIDAIYEDDITTETINNTTNIINYYIASVKISGLSSATGKQYEFATNVVLNSENPADQLIPENETTYVLTDASKANINCVYILNAITMKNSFVFRSDGLPTLFDMCLSTNNKVKLTLIGYLKSTDEVYKINESIMTNTDITSNSIHYNGKEVKCIKIYNDTFVESSNVQSKSFANVNNILHTEDIYFDFDNANMALSNSSTVTGPSSAGSVIFDITRSNKRQSKPVNVNIGSTRYDIYSGGSTGMDRNYTFIPHTSDFNSNRCKVIEYVDASLVKDISNYSHTYYDKSKSSYVTPSNMTMTSNDNLINSFEYRFNTANDAISNITEKITYLHDKQNVLIVPTAGDMNAFELGLFDHRNEKFSFKPSTKPVTHTILGYRNTINDDIHRTIPSINGVYYLVTDKSGTTSYHPPIPTTKTVTTVRTVYVHTATSNRSTTRPLVSDTVPQLKFETIGSDGNIVDTTYEPPLTKSIESMNETELNDLNNTVANSTYQIVTEVSNAVVNLTKLEIDEIKQTAIPLVQDFVDVIDNVDTYAIEYKPTSGYPAYLNNLYFNDNNELNCNVSLVVKTSSVTTDLTSTIYTSSADNITMHGTLYSAIGKWTISKPTIVTLTVPKTSNDISFILTIGDGTHTYSRRMINSPFITPTKGFVVYVFNTMNRNATAIDDIMTDRISGYPEYTHTSNRIITISPETITINGTVYPLDYSFYHAYREPIYEFNDSCVYAKVSGYIYRSTYMLRTSDIVTDKILNISPSSINNVSNEGLCRIDVKYLQVSNHNKIINVDANNNITQMNRDYRSTFGASCFNISITPVAGSKQLTLDYTIDPNELYIDSTMREKSMFGKFILINNKVYDIFNIMESKLSISNVSGTLTDNNATNINLYKETYSIDTSNGIYIKNNNCYETMNADKHYIGGYNNGELIYTKSNTFINADSEVMKSNISNNVENTPNYKHRYTRVINANDFECSDNPQGFINPTSYRNDDYSFIIVPKSDINNNTIDGGNYQIVHRNANNFTNFCSEDQLYKIKDMTVKVMNTKIHISKPVSRDMMLYDLNQQRSTISDADFNTFLSNISKTITIDDTRNVTNRVLALKLVNPIGNDVYVSPTNMPTTSFKLIYDPKFVVTSANSKGNVTFATTRADTRYFSNGSSVTKTGYSGIETLLKSNSYSDFDTLEAYRVRTFKCTANDTTYMIALKIDENQYRTLSDTEYNSNQLSNCLKIIPRKANGSTEYNQLVLLDRYGSQVISEVDDVKLMQDGSLVSTGRFSTLINGINSEVDHQNTRDNAIAVANNKMNTDKQTALNAKNSADSEADRVCANEISRLNTLKTNTINTAYGDNATERNTVTSRYNLSISNINAEKLNSHTAADTTLATEKQQHINTFNTIKGTDCCKCSVCLYNRPCRNGVSNCGTCEVCIYKNRVCPNPVAGKACGTCEVCKLKRNCLAPVGGKPCGKCEVCLYKSTCVSGNGAAKDIVAAEVNEAKITYDTVLSTENQKKQDADALALQTYNNAIDASEKKHIGDLAFNTTKYNTSCKQADNDKFNNDTKADNDYKAALAKAADDRDRAVQAAETAYTTTTTRATDAKDPIFKYAQKLIHMYYDDAVESGETDPAYIYTEISSAVKESITDVYRNYMTGVPIPAISKDVFDFYSLSAAQQANQAQLNKRTAISDLTHKANANIISEYTRIVNEAGDVKRRAIDKSESDKSAYESAAQVAKEITLTNNTNLCNQAKNIALTQKGKDDTASDELYRMSIKVAEDNKTESLMNNETNYNRSIEEATNTYNTIRTTCDRRIAETIYNAAKTKINDDALSDSKCYQSKQAADNKHRDDTNTAIATRDEGYRVADKKMNDTINAITKQTPIDIATANNMCSQTKQLNLRTYNSEIDRINDENAAAIALANSIYNSNRNQLANDLLASINSAASVPGLFNSYPVGKSRYIINCFVKDTLVNVVDTCKITDVSCDYFKVSKVHQHYMPNKGYMSGFKSNPRTYLQRKYGSSQITTYLADPIANEHMMYCAAYSSEVTYINGIGYMMITDEHVADTYSPIHADVSVRVKNICSFNDGTGDYIVCLRGSKTKLNSYPNTFTNSSIAFAFTKSKGYFESNDVEYDIYDVKTNTLVLPVTNSVLTLNYIHNTYHIDDIYIRKYDSLGVHDVRANDGSVDITYNQNRVASSSVSELNSNASTVAFINETGLIINDYGYITDMKQLINQLPNTRSTRLVDADKFNILRSNEEISVSYRLTGSYALIDNFDDSNRLDRTYINDLQNQYVASYISNGSNNNNALQNAIVAKYAELGYHTTTNGNCDYSNIIEYNKIGFFYEYNKNIPRSNELSHSAYHYVNVYDISKEYFVIPFRTYNVPVSDNVICDATAKTISYYDMIDRYVTAPYTNIVSNKYICSSVMNQDGVHSVSINTDSETISFKLGNATYTYRINDVYMGSIRLFDNTTLEFHETAIPRSSNDNKLSDRSLRFIISDALNCTTYSRNSMRKVYTVLSPSGEALYSKGSIMYNQYDSSTDTRYTDSYGTYVFKPIDYTVNDNSQGFSMIPNYKSIHTFWITHTYSSKIYDISYDAYNYDICKYSCKYGRITSADQAYDYISVVNKNNMKVQLPFFDLYVKIPKSIYIFNNINFISCDNIYTKSYYQSVNGNYYRLVDNIGREYFYKLDQCVMKLKFKRNNYVLPFDNSSIHYKLQPTANSFVNGDSYIDFVTESPYILHSGTNLKSYCDVQLRAMLSQMNASEPTVLNIAKLHITNQKYEDESSLSTRNMIKYQDMRCKQISQYREVTNYIKLNFIDGTYVENNNVNNIIDLFKNVPSECVYDASHKYNIHNVTMGISESFNELINDGTYSSIVSAPDVNEKNSNNIKSLMLLRDVSNKHKLTGVGFTSNNNYKFTDYYISNSIESKCNETTAWFDKQAFKDEINADNTFISSKVNSYNRIINSDANTNLKQYASNFGYRRFDVTDRVFKYVHDYDDTMYDINSVINRNDKRFTYSIGSELFMDGISDNKILIVNGPETRSVDDDVNVAHSFDTYMMRSERSVASRALDDELDSDLSSLFNNKILNTVNYINNVAIKKVIYYDDESLFGLSKAHTTLSKYVHDISVFPTKLKKTFKSNVVIEIDDDNVIVDKSNNVSFHIAAVKNANDIEIPNIYKIKIRNFVNDRESDSFTFTHEGTEFIFSCDNVKYVTDPITGASNAAPIDKNLSMTEYQPVIYTHMSSMCVKTGNLQSGNLTDETMKNIKKLSDDNNAKDTMYTYTKIMSNHDLLYDVYFDTIRNNISAEKNNFTKVEMYGTPSVGIQFGFDCIPVTTDIKKSRTLNFLNVMQDINFNTNHDTYRLNNVMDYNKGTYKLVNNSYNLNRYDETKGFVDDYYYNFTIDDDLWKRLGFNPCRINDDDVLKYTRYGDNGEPVYIVKGKYYSEEIYNGPINVPHNILINEKKVIALSDNNTKTTITKRIITPSDDLTDIGSEIIDKYFNKPIHYGERMLNLSVPSNIDVHVTQNEDVEKVINDADRFLDGAGLIGSYNVIRANEPVYNNIQQSIEINQTVVVPEKGDLYVYLSAPNQRYPIINSEAMLNIEYIK